MGWESWDCGDHNCGIEKILCLGLLGLESPRWVFEDNVTRDEKDLEYILGRKEADEKR